MSSREDAKFMGVAINLSRRAVGCTAENPPVGAVLVKHGVIVGRGITQPGGRPHAEPMAIEQAGSDAAGGCLYVTLEPCSHHGKTPPCADAIIAAGIGRVVVACDDPDPRVSGRGIAKMRAANIEVVEQCETHAAQQVLAGFLSRLTRGRPEVSLKLATSADGRIALANGASKWITGPVARQHGHILRATHDAILVGSETLLADSPSLTCRIPGVLGRDPIRVVLDRRGRVSPAVLAGLADSPAVVFQGRVSATHDKVDVLAYPENVTGILNALADRGVNRLLIEGGGRIAAAFLQEKLVDNLYHYQAPKILGGDGRAAVAELGYARLSDVSKWQLVSNRKMGADRLAYYRRAE